MNCTLRAELVRISPVVQSSSRGGRSSSRPGVCPELLASSHIHFMPNLINCVFQMKIDVAHSLTTSGLQGSQDDDLT